MEHIPTYIFDWIEQKAFNHLSLKEQQEVLQHISQEEYNQLHQAAIVATTYAKQHQENITTNTATQAHLNTVFDKHYPTEKRQLSPILLWKVAASFLLLVTGILSFGWYKAHHQKTEAVTHIITDTVFVDRAKAVPYEFKVYDTVYIKKQPKNDTRTLYGRRPKYLRKPFNYRDELLQENPLNSIPFSDKDQPQNRPKNNSIKDDTLVQKFNFVQL